LRLKNRTTRAVAVLSRRTPRRTERMIHMTSDPESLQLALYDRIATELALKPEQVQRTVALLLDDATVPFIARYRKEATGNLDEEQIRCVAERHKYYQELEQRRDRKSTRLNSSHRTISYAVFCLKKKKQKEKHETKE